MRVIRSLVGGSLHYRLLVLGLAGAALLYGATQLARVSVDAVPEFVPPYVEIQTEALGLSADEVEQLITVPMEADLLHGVAFLDRIESESVPGLSSIVLTFEPGTDVFRARQMVTERLTQAHALPNVSKPPTMLQPLSSASRVQMVALTSTDISLIDLSVLARWTIRPRLMSVPGVANVAIWGQRERQLQVLVDPQRLQEQRIALAHVIETAGNAMWVSPLTFLDASTPGTGGFIDTPNQRLSVQHLLAIHSAEDLAQVPIAPEDTGGRLVLLGSVADIVEDHQPLIGDAVLTGDPGLLLVIEKFPGANTLEVTRGIEAAFEAMRPGLGGVDIDTTIYRPATYLEEVIQNLSLALLAGGVLLAAILLAFLYSLRRAMVALLSIIASLAIAAIVLVLLGATINAVLVAGLVMALGVVVDEAAGAAARSGAPLDASTPRAERIRAAILDGRRSMIIATAIIIGTAIPAWFTSDAGAVFLPALVVPYLAAVATAAVLVLTFTPALLSLIGPTDPALGRDSPVVGRFRGAYAAGLGRMLAWRRPVAAVTAVLAVLVVVGAGLGVARSTSPLLPTLHEPHILVRWSAAPGTSHGEMTRIVSRAGAELAAVPGVTGVGSHVGRAITSDQVVGIDSAELWLSLDNSADYDQTLDAIQEVVDGYPGISGSVVSYSSARIDDVLRAPPEDLIVRIYGNDQSSLTAKADEVRAAVAEIDGIHDATIDSAVTEPTIEVEVDLAAAEQHGIKAGDVRRAATTLVSGIQVGSLFEAQKVFEVVVWGTPETRHSLTSIEDLRVQAPGGPWVRLGDVADVRIAAAPSVVRREGVFRTIDVTAQVSGRDLGEVTRDVQRQLDRITFPLESHAELTALGLDRQAQLGELRALLAAALIAAYLLLQAATASWRRAAVLLFAVPAGLTGCLVGAWLAGEGASIGVIGGFLAVLGVGLRQALRLADRIACLEAADSPATGAAPDTRDAIVLAAARDRLTTLLATPAATIGALVPIVVMGDAAGLEIVHSLALVIIGGLVTSTLVSLFVVPAVLRATPAAVPQTELSVPPQPLGAGPA